MKIIALGCTHTHHNYVKIPPCDVLIHTGDYTSVGSKFDYTSFYNWLESLTQCKHKIFIEGNHELGQSDEPTMRKYRETAHYEDWLADIEAREEDFKKNNIHRLHNEELIIDGVKFWGSPYTLAFYDWAFNMNLDELHDNWEKMPEDTDVLITHGPPLGKLDKCVNGHHAGDSWLLQKVLEIRPKYHVFSHIHESAGETTIGVNGEHQTKLFNCSILDENYIIRNKPVEFHI